MDLLRFSTAGNVDDGKSTLIGRLLLDSGSVPDDQRAAVEQASARRGHDGLDLSLLTDGLKAEREQGITIDVAYRYFSTPRRKLIIADSPGHVQYTRNMVTAASTADLSVILVDATRGVTEQTKRHASVVALLRVPHLVVCVNKMDLAGYEQRAFDRIRAAMESSLARLELDDVVFLPVSALAGDNVVATSEKMRWYDGPPLLSHLESVVVDEDAAARPVRFPVQLVLRADDGRRYAGSLASGALRVGDEVTVLPSGLSSRVQGLEKGGVPVAKAVAPAAVSLRLEDELDVSRGDMIVRRREAPRVEQDLEVMVCWMDRRPLAEGRTYTLQHTTRSARCVVKRVHEQIDMSTLERTPGEALLEQNGIGRVTLRASAPLCFDSYASNRATGALILVDEATQMTAGAGMLL